MRKPKVKKGEPLEAPDDREQNYTNLHLNLKSILKKNNNTVMLTFKDMTLLIMKTDGKKTTVEYEKKYKIGDIGKMHYVRELKAYVKEGYEVIERKDNIDELFKEQRKRKTEETTVDE